MSSITAVSKTAPIPIAPKPPPPRVSGSVSPSTSRRPRPRQDNTNRSEQPRISFRASSSTSLSSLSRPGRLCDACRQARINCVVMPDDDEGCASCQADGTCCSLAGSPRARKRKLNGDSAADVSGKRRQVVKTTNKLNPITTWGGDLLADMANVGGPTRLKRTLGLQNDRYSQYIGPTTDFEPSLINLSPFNPDDESLLSRGTLRKVSEGDTFLMLPDSKTPGYDRRIQDADEIEKVVAPHGKKLIDLYFEVVHPAFPIIQKAVFLEKYDRGYREFSPCLLAAVYILAANWWHHSERLTPLSKPNVQALERLVRSTLADQMSRPKLSTIQAGLLLSQRPEGDQWAPTAQLVAIAQELGLHLDCRSWKIPPWEKGLRKRLAWALYMQDKWGALVHGRPSHIFTSNWAVQPVTEHDFPDVDWDESDPEEEIDVRKGRLVFVRMVRLTLILAEILDTFYTLNAMQGVAAAGPKGPDMVLALAKPIQLKLKDWHLNIESVIRMDSSPSTIAAASKRCTSIGHLHLAYFATEITLHRRIIRALSSAPPGEIEPYLIDICRGASKARLISAMDFVNRLTPTHLRSWWYFASKTNFALIGTFGSLLWATSESKEEAEWYRMRLGEYRWTLSVSSKPGEGKGLTNFAMTMLDISTGLLKKLPEKPTMSRNTSISDIVGIGNLGSMASLSRPVPTHHPAPILNGFVPMPLSLDEEDEEDSNIGSAQSVEFISSDEEMDD